VQWRQGHRLWLRATTEDVGCALKQLLFPLRDPSGMDLELFAQLGHGLVLTDCGKATRTLNAAVCVRRVRRADFFTIKNSFSPDHFRPSFMPGVSTYRAVQIRRATSGFNGILDRMRMNFLSLARVDLIVVRYQGQGFRADVYVLHVAKRGSARVTIG
jgi:hypothetical protein